jgi:integrase
MQRASCASLQNRQQRGAFLSKEECAALLAVCSSSSSPHLHDVVVLAISTGMRRNEILQLRRRHVDVAHGMIYLDDTKNGTRRGVPLSSQALDLMRERLKVPGVNEDLVFVGKTGTTPFDMRKPWYRALELAKLKGLRFHDLRHTAASFLAKGGASSLEIGAVLGHKSPAMTKRYSHFTNAHLRDVVGAMNERIFRTSE